MSSPAAVIGEAAVSRLYLAGYDIVVRQPEVPTKRIVTFTCPVCAYSAQGGQLTEVYADYGQAWHEPCVPLGSSSQRRAGRSMKKAILTASPEVPTA